MTGEELLELTIRDRAGGIIDRSTVGPGDVEQWLERWAAIVDQWGVTVDLDTQAGERVGRLTDHGLELTELGAAPLILQLFGILGIKP